MPKLRLPRSIRRAALATAATVAVAIVPATGVGAEPWEPGPVLYGVGYERNLPVTMSDGTVLRVDIYYPTDPATGAAADGSFPVILTQTPYGKTISGYLPELAGAGNSYLIGRGYIQVVADIRGTGGSQGSWGPLDPIQGSDGAELVRWAAALPHSNGRVGTLGPSYLALIQFLTAASVGPDSPLKAMFPIVVGADLYRDVIFQGGIVDMEFAAWYLPLMLLANMGNPILEHRTDPLALPATELDHARGLTGSHVDVVTDIETGGDRAYYSEYWQERTPSAMIPRIVSNGVAAFIVGGWNDLFVRGTPLLYSGFQNAYAGRPVDAPMQPGGGVTGRYHLLMGPWYHVEYGQGQDLNPIMLRWFDRFLKDDGNGIDESATPLHTYEMGTGRWLDVASYPYEQALPTTLFLDGDGRLSPTQPAAPSGSDTILYTGVSNACSKPTQQWGAGALILAGELPAACAGRELIPPLGPAALSYTTAPFADETVLAGPIGATLYATSTRPDAELIATLYDVAPDGSAAHLTAGALLGSHRVLDESRTWTASDGRPFLPWHPYTKAATAPVTPGAVTRFDVEIFPTFARLAAGHSLRLVITTSDTPHLVPIPSQLANLVGGVYRVQRNTAAASFLEVPLGPADAFAEGCGICR